MVSKECVKAKGINGFGMRDVANSSGFALGTVCNFFIDKETMIIETLVSTWKDYITSIPSTDSFMDYLLSVISIMDDIESTYHNFLKTHPRHISDSKVLIDKEMVNRELQNIKNQIISTINRDMKNKGKLI